MGAQRRSREEWAGLIAEQEALGMSSPEFAQGHGLKVATLRWWRWWLREERSGDRRPRGFLEVVPLSLADVPARQASEPDGRARLALPGGVQVELDRTPSPHWLAALAHALEAR